MHPSPPREELRELAFQGWACLFILLLCVAILLFVFWGDMRSLNGRNLEEQGVAELDLESQTDRRGRLVTETSPLLSHGDSELTMGSTAVGSPSLTSKRTDSDLSSYSAVTPQSDTSPSTTYGGVTGGGER
ncbi:hypothetical protein N656DRAFT_539000 [Canariomyces notabilis]|jgi:hypothetical protein|uniref:Uncharacterized protein n=1 Tax=Canariomyces notabilis TaxID=2074819 RepID=A0AAN6THQ2_9PEZI|nr:hypothetical protein N656DRAFT_539000 [Canariomyces arenarius]